MKYILLRNTKSYFDVIGIEEEKDDKGNTIKDDKGGVVTKRVMQKLDFSYYHEILELTQYPAVSGRKNWTPAESRNCSRVQRALLKMDEEEGILSLEDEDWEFLRKLVQEQERPISDPVIAEYVTDIVEATDTEPIHTVKNNMAPFEAAKS